MMEYKCETFPFQSDIKTTEEGLAQLAKATEFLNNYAAGGWDLVSVIDTTVAGSPWYVAIFKRVKS